LVGQNYFRLREILYKDLENHENNEKLMSINIFCIFLVETFIRPGNRYKDRGLLSLRKDEINIETIDCEIAITISHVGKRGSYIAKQMITPSQRLYDRCKYFKDVDSRTPLFFSRLVENSHLRLLNIVLPGTTAVQIRRSEISNMCFSFFWLNKANLEEMATKRKYKFDCIKRDIGRDPVFICHRAFRHLQIALDHKSIITTIMYIDIILIYWLFNTFF
jgi:hypothetical protein